MLKIQDGGSRHLEKSKNSDISATVWPIATKFGKRYAIHHSWRIPQLEICNFKNPRWRRPPFWKVRKIDISRPRFRRFRRNLAWWRSSTLHKRSGVANLKFKQFRMAEAAILKNPKIAISRQRFDRSAQHLARWRILALRTGPTVEISNI